MTDTLVTLKIAALALAIIAALVLHGGPSFASGDQMALTDLAAPLVMRC